MRHAETNSGATGREWTAKITSDNATEGRLARCMYEGRGKE